MVIVIGILLFLLPLILAFATNNFIVREAVLYGQPDVKFTNEFIAEALLSTGATTSNIVKQFSTVANINNKYSNPISNPQLSVNPYDRNGDLKAEKLTLEFEFLHLSTENVKALNILFYLQYTIDGEINTQFKTVVYKSFSAPSNGGIVNVKMRGDLELNQKNPLAVGTIKRELYSTSLEDDFNNYGIPGILDRITLRNQTTVYNAEPIINSFTGGTKTKIVMDINIPLIQETLYFTSVLQMLKLAWIEYFALLIPIYVILYLWIYGFIVKSKV